jgi:AraC-like DNA-binding protein
MLYALRVWLADHSSLFQYPPPIWMVRRAAMPSRSLEQQSVRTVSILVLVYAPIIIVCCLVALYLLGIVAWALIETAFAADLGISSRTFDREFARSLHFPITETALEKRAGVAPMPTGGHDRIHWDGANGSYMNVFLTLDGAQIIEIQVITKDQTIYSVTKSGMRRASTQ